MPEAATHRLQTSRRPQLPRSRNGCLTCKRRKVRCNEEKPVCGHCSRLRLECHWKNADAPTPPAGDPARFHQPMNHTGTVTMSQQMEQPQQQTPFGDPMGFSGYVMDPLADLFAFREPSIQGSTGFDATQTDGMLMDAPTTSVSSNASDVDDTALQMTVPPILEPVENGPKWASARALFQRMAASSTMVRSAVVAFAAIQSQRSQGRASVDYRPLYDRAATELSAKLLETDGKTPAVDEELVCILTTVFLLAYIDLLTDRTDLAHLNIQKAHNAIQRSKKTDVGPLERRIISWIRLLDARAATAGGEGPFVNDNTGLYAPPIQTRASGSTPQRTSQSTNGNIEEIVYDLLCQPGLAFFQEVQSITGRITKIDHYRRSRGTVEDETEVMATAAEIMKDLASLYDCRPSIMDHAVAGDLGENVIARHLAQAIIRSYRTYLANFYACYIHIHRVAHRHLPRSKMLIKAIGEIKGLVHRMMANGEPLPVNILWPLFLWGSEEDDPQECRWIVDTIRSLQHVVTNAANVANLLQEVQRRQLERGQRVDIRTVSMELFNSSFAIV